MKKNLFDITARFADKATMVTDVRRFLSNRIRLAGRKPTVEELEPTEASVADARLWLGLTALVATGIAREYDTSAKRDVEFLLNGELKSVLRLSYELMLFSGLLSIGAPIGNGDFSNVPLAIRRQTVINLFAAAHTLLETDVRDGYAIPSSRWYART